MNDPGHLNAPGRQINAGDDESYEVTWGWKSESGTFFTTINTKGGGHNQIRIDPDERWRFVYELTAENATAIHFTLQILIENDEVKVIRLS
jgi:hypothetical protein